MHWILFLSAVLPLITGYFVIRGMIYYSRKEFSARNVSPSYFAAIALLFALFASLIFGEVWNRVANINARMLTQASSLRGILRITENIPNAAQPFRVAVRQYINEIEHFEGNMPAFQGSTNVVPEREAFSNKTFQPLYKLATDSILFNGNAVLQQEVLRLTDELRNAWFEREELLKQRVLPEKVLILFLMGFFTQLSIAFSHLGNDRAIRDTVWLFSLVFFAALAILLSIDDTALSRHFISLSVLRDVH